MHLIIDDNVANVDFSLELNIHILENILASGMDGNHYLSASRSTLNQLLQLENIGSRYKGYLRHLIAKISFDNLTAIFSKSIVIKSDIENPQKDEVSGQWQIPFILFRASQLNSPTVLLCENIRDCELLEYAANHFKITKKYKHIEIKNKKRLGGGSTTFQALDLILNEAQEFCLCIVDSDKKSPNSRMGETYKKCDESMRGIENWNAKLIPTFARELENDLPKAILREALSENLILYEALNKVIAAVELTHEDYWNYIDLKKGVDLEWILSAPEPESSYWTVDPKLLPLVEEYCQNSCVHEKSCARPQACNTHTPFPAICENILDRVLAWLKINSYHKSAEIIAAEDSIAWLSLGNHVFNFCAADKVYRL